MKSTKKTKNIVSKEMLLDDKTPFAVKEAFGLLKTNIIYMPSEDNDGAKVIAVTSAEGGAGKSTITANMALSFANGGAKVVLIDADMRCPKLHRFFKYNKHTKGLSEYLAGICERADVVMHSKYENLDIIGSGRIPPSPADLFLGTRFADLMADLKKEYDYVFVDFPPIGIVTDATAVASSVTGYIFVVRANGSDEMFVKESVSKIEQVEGHIIGFVMNGINYKQGVYKKDYKYHRYYKYESSKYSHQPSSPQNSLRNMPKSPSEPEVK